MTMPHCLVMCGKAMAGCSGQAFADIAAMHHQSFKLQAFLAVRTIYMFTGCVFSSINYVLSKYITFTGQGFILLYNISRASYALWSITLPVNLRGNGAFFLAKAAAEVLTGDSPAVALPPSQAVALALELVVELTVRAQITVDVLPLEGP